MSNQKQMMRSNRDLGLLLCALAGLSFVGSFLFLGRITILCAILTGLGFGLLFIGTHYLKYKS